MTRSSLRHQRGFTLIELMITVAVIAILSGIALPSYNAYVLRSHRAEAKNTLLALAQRLEQNYTLSSSYASTAANAAIDDTSIAAWGMNQVPLSGSARYNIAFSGSPTATEFVLMATPVGAQASDTCGVMSLNNRNLKRAAGFDNRHPTTRNCWDR